jgi:hypothetical protein
MKTIKWNYDWTPDGATLAEGDSPNTFASIEFNPALSDEAQADIMHKIAAAPELLAALQVCLDYIDANTKTGDLAVLAYPMDKAHYPQVEARQAIRKAQGEA